MLQKNKIVWLTGFLFFSGILVGCGSAKRIESQEVPNQPMPNEQALAQKQSSENFGNYMVQKQDCLWTIAGKTKVYGDPFEWPLLFKANRDQIQDPDLIYPRQDLRVQKILSREERNHARQTAMATPKYVPHSKPRETLPVDYF